MSSPFFDVDAIIADRQTKIMICCGAGGVGKTTTSAALALRAAEAGRKVVVLTIDPARRLAQSLGVGELGNTPRPVAGLEPTNGGSLDAMMLDMKRTFDDVVIAHAPPDKAAAVLQNPFYEALSTSFSGTQEYMAMEKLGQLHHRAEADGNWDLIIVDTPPARSALDFLDAPEHLSDLLDGPFLRMLLAPTGGPLRLMSAGFHLLASAHTTFLVVATAQRDALREAAYFVDRLLEEHMPLAGMVINRVHSSQLEISAERALAIAEDLDPQVAAVEIEALRRHAALERVIDQETLLLDRFSAARPAVPRTLVSTLAGDVTDLDTLRRVGVLLADKD